MYEVPTSKAGIESNRFEFKIGEDTFSVPLMQYLPGTVVDLMAAAEEKGGIHVRAAEYAIFGESGTPAGDAVRKLDAEQLDALLSAYQEASRLHVGESSASTDS